MAQEVKTLEERIKEQIPEDEELVPAEVSCHHAPASPLPTLFTATSKT